MSKSNRMINKEEVRDWKTFIEFLRVLSEEEANAQNLIAENPEKYKYDSVLGWENDGIAQYLNAISSCLEDGKWFKDSQKLDWKELAEIFYMGKIYE